MSDESPNAGPDLTGPYSPPVPPSPGERFAPGAVLAGRYRIVAPLGRGGMGEVYRADDLALGQPVALKFLPAHFADDPDRLARFRKEVAVARKVSHPNCCRVYDLAEADGQSFLSMEYIDGEDLASLFRRIGRLPEDKATAIARELCAGLTAVHDQGLLHRDLKPANIMLDGRGKVRLTDFGLAASVEELSPAEPRSGTPAYMAPEQLAGQDVTVRSDLFALGLVLYELFTGKKAFSGTDRDTRPSKPSSHVQSLDPAVERAVLRCLESEPAERPKSALAVAAALPGGDPLAAALAAGETPSPQLVADAGGEGVIRPGVGLALLGTVVGSIVIVALLADRVMLFRKVPLPEPPEILARRARQLLEHLGYPGAPADSAYHFRVNAESLLRTLHEDQSPDRWERLATVRPAALYFFYRQSPQPLAASVVTTGFPIGSPQDLLVTDVNPPALAGMSGVHLDPRGALLRLYAIPARESDGPSTPSTVDWARWFDKETVGFDLLKDLRSAEPRWSPPCACDRQSAWIGTLPDRPDWPVRVEAAAYHGRPVYFEIMHDAKAAEWADPAPAGFVLANGLAILLALIVLTARNLRRGRGDVRGAIRIALAVMAVVSGAWLIAGHHTLSQEWTQVVLVLGCGGSLAALYGVAYLALEPPVGGVGRGESPPGTGCWTAGCATPWSAATCWSACRLGPR